MQKADLIILNLNEIRRRSELIWKALPTNAIQWKPDNEAMTAIEMVRHVLEADYGWQMIIQNKSLKNYKTPWVSKPFVSVEDELEFAKPYRTSFLESIKAFSDQELNDLEIIHPGNGESKNLSKYLLRIGYHESVHAGQFLSYLRAMNVVRPNIWD